MIRTIGRKSLIFLPLLFILLYFYFPLLRVLSKGLNSSDLLDILKSNYYRQIIRFTFFQAFLSALLSILIALPASYIVTRYNFAGKKLFMAATSLPFVLPSILTVLGFVILFGKSGFINNFLMSVFNFDKPPVRVLHSLKAVLLAHIFYNFPLAIRIISSLWKKIPYKLSEASYSLGSGKIKTFFQVTLPYLRNGIITSFTLIFLYCFMSFAIILVLGGGPSLSTIEVEIYRFVKVSLNIPKAAALATIESIITVLVLFIYIKSEKNKFGFTLGKGITKKISFKLSALYSIYLIPLLLIVAGPIISIIVNSLLFKETRSADLSLSLHWYKSLLGLVNNRFTLTAIKAIKNSVVIGLSTVLVSLPFSLLVTYSMNKKFAFNRLYRLLFFLPMGISSLIIGLTYISSSKLTGSYIAIIIAHLIITLPISVRCINNVYSTIDRSLIESSLSLGYNRFQTFKHIEVPLLRSGIVTSAIFTFSLSMGEMNASIMLAPSGFTTIPLAIHSLIGNYQFQGACALGSILLIICLITFKIMDNMDN